MNLLIGLFVFQGGWPSTQVIGGIMMRKIILASLSLLFLGDLMSGTKKEFWEEKDYRQWTTGECARLLENSPWAQKMSFGDIEYIIRLRSALPVRQAIIRQNQLALKYEKLIPEKKMAFDQRAESFLSQSLYDENIVVAIKYRPIDAAIGGPADQYWANPTATKFVSLYCRSGSKAPMLNYVPPDEGNREFQYVFPRTRGGRPVMTAEDKELVLEFPTEFISKDPQGTIVSPPAIHLIHFRAESMKVNGTPEF
jgi:hypothetical protein